MIKLIAFDLDDTLAKLGKGILWDDLLKLRALEQKGISIALCSGKPTYYLCGLMRQVELERPVLVGENGAVIQIGVDLPPKQFYVQESSPEARQSIKRLREQITQAIPHMWYQPNLVGLTPFPASKEEFETVQRILDDCAPKLKGVKIYRHCDSYDIVPIGIDKNSGMERLGRILGVTPSETIAVGNGCNDYPMFEYAGFAVGVHVPDEQKVNVNFETPAEALSFLLDYVEESHSR